MDKGYLVVFAMLLSYGLTCLILYLRARGSRGGTEAGAQAGKKG